MFTGQPQLAFKYAGRRAFHHNSGPFALPFNDQPATQQLHLHPGVQQSPQATRHHGSAGPAAACHGFTGTTFKDPQAGVCPINNLKKSDIGPRGKARVAFK
jgi:hypothetical protein